MRPFGSLIRGVLLAALASVVLPAAASAQSSWDDVVAKAKEEGSVVFYTVLVPPQMDALAKAWREAYPDIELQYIRNTEAVLIPKIQQEQSLNALAADLYAGTTYDFFLDQNADGKLVKPTGPDADAYPQDAFLEDMAPVINALPMGIAYNTQLVETPPTSYTDLLNPEFKGSVGTILSNASAAMTSLYDYMRIKNPGFWQKLAAQNPRFYPSTVPMTQAVASGELKATLITQPANVNPLKDQGAPLAFVLPSEDEVFGIEFLLALFNDAPHPNAARVFANFVLSPEGQAAINGNGLGVSRLADVPGALPSVDIIIFDPKAYPPDRIAEINAEWETTFQP